MQPRVVTSTTLTTLLSRHVTFSETEIISHLSSTICGMALSFRYYEIIIYLMPVFDAWRRVTRFSPKPTHPPNLVDFKEYPPVQEYVQFGRKTFYRKRHDIGVVFATFVPLEGRITGVVWTTARKAHLFEHIDGAWTLVKTLNRQDVPFLTWMRFLGGRELCQREEEAAERHRYENRHPHLLFHDMITPFYGTARYAARWVSMRSIPAIHPTWDIVRQASLLTVSENHPSRFEWHRL